ncbi:MAG: ABC transporter ATP-binding protein [Eggerthellaceae bacterium]|nr:ABC transporter ATP-binding protein [Eggerthellaceae bacterium]
MQTQGAHIDFSHVSVEFDDGAELLTACRDVTFAVQPGQAIALIGPSGCGKSTTLRMACGLLTPSEGSVLVNGQPVGKPRQETAFIPQDLGLFPWKTVLQNAALGLDIRKVPKAEARERAQSALQQVDLAGFERSYPKELSGGMRQRLALARALAMRADLLLMDEPLSAIDALLRESLQDTLLDLWRERKHTQMLVTHSIEEAVYLGQRIIVFSARPGTVIADIPNPGMGDADWRDSLAFAEKCLEVRRVLASGSSQWADGEGDGR